jgi:hypothetical protein
MKNQNLLHILIPIIFLFIACKKNTAVDPTDPGVAPPTAKKLILTGQSYKPGNSERGILDSFSLQFNHPVHINYLYFESDYCLPDLRFKTTGDHSKVVFDNFLCGALGAENPFIFSVTDSSGETLVDTTTFSCYTKKYVTAGTLINYYISQDNRYCWAITQFPNQLICFGIMDTAYKKVYDLNFSPFNLVYNPYNSKLYLLSGQVSHRDSIFVFNPSAGVIDKIIGVPPDDGSDPQHPKIFPYGLAFGLNGFGVLLVEDDASNPIWKVIDSRANDSIYISPAFLADGNTRLASFSSVFTNFDQSKLIMLENYGHCRLGVMDCTTHELTEQENSLSPHYYSQYIIPNKTSDKVLFINAPSGLFIVSAGNTPGAVMDFDALGSPSADFSYKSTETNFIYYLDSHVIGIVDFNSGLIRMSTNLKANLNNIRSTTDGKYLFAMGSNYLEMFETDTYFKSN